MNIKKFLNYVIPSVLAFALSGIYAIVDGFFVGNSVGDAGITAINLVYPVVSVLQALGTGIGMGGAIQYSVLRASGKQSNANRYIGGTVTCLIAASIIMPAVTLPFLDAILKLLGSSGVVAEYGKIYLLIVISGSVCQIFGTGITPMVRNNGGAAFSMFTMIAGFLTNVVLDYTLVWVLDKGVAGAALATVIGQLVTAIIGASYLIWKKIPIWKLQFKSEIFLRIAKIGSSAFGITLCPNFSLLFMNLFLIRYGGELSVACYAVISYASYIVYLVLQGVGDGCQPLISDYYGKGDTASLRKAKKMAYVTAEIIASICFLLLYIARDYIGKLFGASDAVCEMVSKNLPVILIGFLFLAYARVTTSLFYATQQAVKSTVLVYSEIIFLLILLLIFPAFFGEPSIWWCMSAAQIMAMLLAAALNLIKKKSY